MQNFKGFVVGIVGSEAAKFTPETEQKAKDIIKSILTASSYKTAVSSGHCHLGGIDIWAENIGAQLGLSAYIFPPKSHSWPDYKTRNLHIVAASDEVHCITVKELPANYKGMRFPYCYHCHTNEHVKSGGCWTAKQAEKAGKKAFWHVI